MTALLRAAATLALLIAPPLCAAPLPPLPPHPRLIMNDTRLAAVKHAIGSDAQAQRYFAALQAQGAHVLATAPLPRPPENASDILSAARAVLTRVTITSLLWRLTADARFAARAAAELLSIVSWQDWDISKHALDTGELSLAAAVGLDWCFDAIGAADRATIVAGIVNKSGGPFRAAYAAGAHGSSWWTCDASNWAQVTNGGAAVAALAIIGEAGVPGWYADLLQNATAGVLCSATAGAAFGAGYAPDGAWWEGPIYAGYSARYFVPFAAAMESALGDASFFALPGVALAAAYQMRVMGPAPAYAYFNWADAEEGQETLAMLLAVAARSGDAAAAFTLRDRLDAAAAGISPARIDTGDQSCMEFAHALIHWTAIGSAADRDALPLDAALPFKKVALLRSSWSDPNATFVGFKACNCSWNHGDLDAGSLVVSWGGERWIADLGADNYALLSYFGADRFEYYRKSSLGHSTLSFNNASQVATGCGGNSRPGPAPPASPATYLSSFGSVSGAVLPAPPGHAPAACVPAPGEEQSCASVDLTPAYQGQGVAAAARRVALRLDGSVRVTDSWAAAPGTRVAAALQTFAAVQVAADGRSALLSRGGRALRVAAGGAACAGAAFVATPVRLRPPFYSTEGLTRLDLVGVAGADCAGFDVTLTGEA